MEKLLNQTLNLRIRVLEEQSDITHIAFNFDHIIQGEVGDDSKRGLPDPGVLLMQILIEMLVVRLDDVGEAMQEVSHGDDDVVFDDGVDVRVVEEFDQVGEFEVAEVGAQAHEFGVRQHADNFQLVALLEVDDYLLDDVDPAVDERVLQYLFREHLDFFYLPLELGLHASHDLVKFLLVLARLGRYLLLLHAFDLALDAVEVNEAFQ